MCGVHPLGAAIQRCYPTASQSHGRLGEEAGGRIISVLIFTIECHVRIHSFFSLFVYFVTSLVFETFWSPAGSILHYISNVSTSLLLEFWTFPCVRWGRLD